MPHARERLPCIAAALAENTHGVDVWLLQEIYGRAAMEAVSSVPGYRAFLAESRPRKQATGLAILVRDDWAAEVLGKMRFDPLDRIEKSIANKGMMVVGVETPLGPIAFGNLHTCYDGRGEQDTKKKAPNLRRQQMLKATVFMARKREGTSAILGGDFNFSHSGEPGNHGILTNAGWRDMRTCAIDHDRAGVTTWSARNPIVRADPNYPDQDIDMLFSAGDPNWQFRTQHMFTEDTVTLADGRKVPLSDHYCLMAEVTNEGTATEPIAEGSAE